eukprot:TRINITY_DN89230_c0_g1_i1.p1 TRINITY_DN89230_c0_g1~~TRINITY_DN89230_c0_g1_i1.p1  ORF type:complete len:1500 (-),score=259.82 TRINITY_DN89230_c0_g1_i1:79-4554(-)
MAFSLTLQSGLPEQAHRTGHVLKCARSSSAHPPVARGSSAALAVVLASWSSQIGRLKARRRRTLVALQAGLGNAPGGRSSASKRTSSRATSIAAPPPSVSEQPATSLREQIRGLAVKRRQHADDQVRSWLENIASFEETRDPVAASDDVVQMQHEQETSPALSPPRLQLPQQKKSIAAASPHVRDSWYDKVGAPEFTTEPEDPGAAGTQPSLHLLQGHRDSFREFLENGFGQAVAEMQPFVRLSNASTVLVSEREAMESLNSQHKALCEFEHDPKCLEELKEKIVPGVRGINLGSLCSEDGAAERRFKVKLMPETMYYETNFPERIARRKSCTLTAKAFVKAKVSDAATGFSFDTHVELGNFPLMTEHGEFIIKGNPYIIVHRLCRSPGPYFKMLEAPKSLQPKDGRRAMEHVIELVTDGWSKFHCMSCLQKASFKLPRAKAAIPAGLFLFALGMSEREIRQARNADIILEGCDELLKGNRSADSVRESACEEVCLLMEQSTTVFNNDVIAAFKYRTSYFTSAKVSSLGRRRYNQKLGISQSERFLTPQDLLAAIDLAIDSDRGVASPQVDEIDSLENKRLRSAGEVIEGLIRRWFNEMNTKKRGLPILVDACTGKACIDKDESGVPALEDFCVKELWKENNRQLSDDTNALSQIMQARRVTQVSDIGLEAIKRIQGIRLIHHSHYGRICPIETGEGMNAGVVMTLASLARITPDGEMEVPHQPVVNGRRLVNSPWEYLLTDEQFDLRVAQFDTTHAADGTLLAPARPEKNSDLASIPGAWRSPESVTVTHLGLFNSCPPDRVEYIACGPPISTAVGLIPFVEHDDANRALMGAKMQQQAVPCLWPERPVVGTGFEAAVAASSSWVTRSGLDGQVLYADSNSVTVTSSLKIDCVPSFVPVLRQKIFASLGCEAPSDDDEKKERDLSFLNRAAPALEFSSKDLNELILRLPASSLEEFSNSLEVAVKEGNASKVIELIRRQYVAIGGEGLKTFRIGGIKPSWLRTIGDRAPLPKEHPLPEGWKETEFSVHSQMSHHLLLDAAPSKKHVLLHDTPVVAPGAAVCSGDFVAERSGITGGELALGKNLIVAYIPFQGYNYEDAIILSERCVREDILTSVHVNEMVFTLTPETDILATPRITMPYDASSPTATCELDYLSGGVPKVGTWLEPDDVVLTLLRADAEAPPNGERTKRWKSKQVPTHVRGRVIDTQVITEAQLDSFGQEQKRLEVKILVAVVCRVEVGDKLAGRHGNKGIVARIAPERDMPYLPDGTPVDVCLNPLGVPSRMNVGQIFENLLGSAGRWNGEEYRVGVFDEMFAEEASRGLVFEALRRARDRTGYKWLLDASSPGKTRLFDGSTGRPFDSPVTVGVSYIIKLYHMVRDKIIARSGGSTGGYSLTTMQPNKGRKRGGGQRLGEMEVSALVGYGASATLQEMLTIKSDDLAGRLVTAESILEGEPVMLPEGATSEGYLTFERELAASGISIQSGMLDDATLA